jgi:hypothetical protein
VAAEAQFGREFSSQLAGAKDCRATGHNNQLPKKGLITLLCMNSDDIAF